MCGQMAVACRDKTSGKIVGYQFGRDMFGKMTAMRMCILTLGCSTRVFIRCLQFDFAAAKLWLFFLNLMADGYTLVNILCSTFMRPGTYKMCQVAHLLHPVLNFSRYRFGHARSGQVLFLGTCVVHPQYRNRGIATKMANMLFEDARKKGFRKVFTWTSTQLAVAQYVKKLRFNVVGSIAYDEVQFNGSRLWRHLTNPVTGEIEKCVHMLDRDL
jgi:GNAT superfamily N-acetyltransferase